MGSFLCEVETKLCTSICHSVKARLQSPASHWRCFDSTLGQPTWDLWWIKWQWGRLISRSFGFSLSELFHKCFRYTFSSLWYSLEIGVVEEWEASNKARVFLQILSNFKEILLVCAQRVKATALESRNKFWCIYLMKFKQIYKPMSVYRG